MMPSTAQYQRLLELRTGLRRFLHWSEEEARSHGITSAQHQLLLAIRGHRGPDDPTVSDLARALVLRHHSVVGLVDRAQAAGLVVRHRDPEHHTLVRLALTEHGVEKLDSLTAAHLLELERLGPAMEALWAAAATAATASAASTGLSATRA
jgi:DNA-binding MarR family transcriptional regulator